MRGEAPSCAQWHLTAWLGPSLVSLSPSFPRGQGKSILFKPPILYLHEPLGPWAWHGAWHIAGAQQTSDETENIKSANSGCFPNLIWFWKFKRLDWENDVLVITKPPLREHLGLAKEIQQLSADMHMHLTLPASRTAKLFLGNSISYYCSSGACFPWRKQLSWWGYKPGLLWVGMTLTL